MPEPMTPPLPPQKTKQGGLNRAGLGYSPSDLSRRVVILVVVLLLTGLLALSDRVHQQIVTTIALAEPVMAQYPVLGGLIFVGLAALSAMLVFFSGVLLVPIGVQTWGEVGCLLLLWSGWCVGGLITYTIGRGLKRPAVKWMVSDGTIARYENRIPEGGSFVTAVLVQLAVPSDISGYFFGLLGYRLRVYFGALMLTELPYAIGTVYLGNAFMQKQYVLLFSVAAVTLVALGLSWLRWRHEQRTAHD